MLCGQAFSAGFCAKRNEQQANRERNRSQRDGNSQRAVTLHSGADKKSDARAREAGKGSGKRERARAALRRILLRQPERVHSKICSAKSQKEKTCKEPRQRLRAEIKDLTE